MIWLLAHSTHRKTEKETQLADGGLRGWAKSRIIRMQESLVLYKSFHTLWNHPSLGGRGAGGGGLYIMLGRMQQGAKYGHWAEGMEQTLLLSQEWAEQTHGWAGPLTNHPVKTSSTLAILNTYCTYRT